MRSPRSGTPLGTLFGYLVFLLIFLVLLQTAEPLYAYGEKVYEKIAFAFDPSADRAYRYGNRHFDAVNPDSYDLPLAEEYFQEAALLDPMRPYVFHQLARIAFIQGDFETALERINLEIARYGEEEPNTYYVRGLILGYMGDYEAAARDYKYFLAAQERNWATVTDYAWILLMLDRPEEAERIVADALDYFPGNPWLLNTHAISLYEMGDIRSALAAATQAVESASKVTEAEWAHAYPGNDPEIADLGLATLRKSARENMHTIRAALASSTVQSTVTP